MSRLSPESMTDGVEVALFLNESALFTLYFESCSDSVIEKYHSISKLLDERLESHRAASGMMDEQAALDERKKRPSPTEESVMRFVYDCLDTDQSINQSVDDEPISFTDFTPRPMTGIQAYNSLYAKRLAVLTSLYNTVYSDIQHFHLARTNDANNQTIKQSSNQTDSTTRTVAINQSKSSLSSIPPLLRWSLLSMFPLISAVSKLDPELRSHTLRILINILQTSPPLSLMHEDDDTIAQMQNIIKPRAGSPSLDQSNTQSNNQSSNLDNVATITSARIGLALQRGSLRHILDSLLPLLDPNESMIDDLVVPHIEPYLTALNAHQQDTQPASILTDDTIIQAFRYHPLPGAQQRSLDRAFNQSVTQSQSEIEAHRAATMVSLTTPLLSHSSSVNTSSSDDLSSPTSPSSQSIDQPNKQLPNLSPLPLPHYGAIASDGRYLYVHSSHGLVRYGSGQHGTVQGHVYAWSGDPFAALVADLSDQVLASYLTPQLLSAYGGHLAYANGWLYFRSTRFAATHKDILAVRIHPDTLIAHSIVKCDADWLAKGERPTWLQMTSDGKKLYFLREINNQTHSFAFDVFEPPSLPPAVDELKIMISYLLPTGWTQFSSNRRYEHTVASLQSAVHFYVGEKVEAKDSINKWCPAEILEVTPTRCLVDYIGWGPKWREYIQIDSGRLVKQGETHPDEAHSTVHDGRKKVRAVIDTDIDVEWSYSRNYIVDKSTEQSINQTDDDWICHTSPHASKLESAYQSMISHAHSNTATQVSTSSSGQSNSIVSLRTQRQSWSVQLNNFTQIDQLGAVHRVRRKVLTDNQSNRLSYVDDVQLACTGQQLLLIIPAYSPANQSRRPLTRVFNIPYSVINSLSDQFGIVPDELTHVADVPLVYAVPSNPPPQPSIDHSNSLSIHSDPVLSSLCYDHLNDELVSFHNNESIIRRWRNTGPKPDIAQPFDCPATQSTVADSTSVSLVARLLASVSRSCRHQRVHSSPQLLQPYCIDVHPDTFRFIHSFLQLCIKPMQSVDQSNSVKTTYVSIITSLLRLLGANLSRLIGMSHTQSLLDTLALLRSSLSDIVELISKADDVTTTSLGREAVDCLVAAFACFYPRPSDLVLLVQDRLAHQAITHGRDQLLDHLSSSSLLYSLMHVDHLDSLSIILDSLLNTCTLEAQCVLFNHNLPYPHSLTLSSSLQLLLVLQKYLIAASINVPDCSQWGTVIEKYVGSTVSCAVDLIDRLSTSRFPHDALQMRMQSTLIGVLLPSLFTILPSVVPHLQFSEHISSSLIRITKSLSQLNEIIQPSAKLISAPTHHLPSSDGESRQFLAGQSPLEFIHAECESTHPYGPEVIDRLVTLRGSLFMAIQFDPRCSTRNSNDSVKVKQGCWNIQCSGSNVCSRAEQPLTQSACRWPTTFVRRPGDQCTVFWQIEKDAKGKQKSAVSDNDRKSAEWGFAVRFHGFRPHPLPRIQYTEISQTPSSIEHTLCTNNSGSDAVPLGLDLQLTLMATVGVVLREGAQQPHSVWHIPVSNPLETETNYVFQPRSLRVRSATEPLSIVREINFGNQPFAKTDDPAVEVDVVNKFNLSVLASSANVFNDRERAFIEQFVYERLPDVISASSDQASQFMAEAVNILIHTMTAHVGGRVHMTSNSKHVMLLVERALLGTLLAHFTCLADALKLAELLLAEKESLPETNKSNGRVTKRPLTTEQATLVTALTPLWQAVCRMCSWLLRHAQSNNKWEGLVCEIEEQSPGTSSAEIEALSFSLLNECSADTLALFCEAQQVDTKDVSVETSNVLLSRIVTREVINRLVLHAKNSDNTPQHDTSLKTLSNGILSMCRFISHLDPVIPIECNQSNLAPLVAYMQAAALGHVTVEQLEKIITAQSYRSRSRAKSLKLSANVLSACTQSIACQTLLHCVLPFPFDARVHAVSLTDMQQLSGAFEHFVAVLADATNNETYDDHELDIEMSYAAHLKLVAHASAMSQLSTLTAATLFQSLVNSSRRLDTAAASERLATHPLPAPSQTRLYNDHADNEPVCCFVYSGATLVQMQNYRCNTCGFNAQNHRVICRTCAVTCHAGHDIIANKPPSNNNTAGTAFCDCFLFNGSSCAAVRITNNSRLRQARQRQASQCLKASSHVIRTFCDHSDLHDRSELVVLLMKEIHTEIQRIVPVSQKVASHSLNLPVNHAACDDERLFEFLALTFHFNVGALENENYRLVVSQFLADLIQIIMIGSTRCQRYAIELVHDFIRNHSVSWFDETASMLKEPSTGTAVVLSLIDSVLPSALGSLRIASDDESTKKRRQFFINSSDALNTSSSTVFESAAASLVAGFFTAIGNVLISPMLMNDPAQVDAEKLFSASCDKNMHDFHGVINQLLVDRYQPSKDIYELFVVRPVFEADEDDRFGDALSGHSIETFAAVFFDKCKEDIEHFRQLEMVDRNVPSVSPATQARKAVPAVLRESIMSSLTTSTSAMIFAGSERACEELAHKISKKGFVTIKRTPQSDTAHVRNVLAETVNRIPHMSQGWIGDHVSGKQRLELTNQMIHLLRSTLSLPSEWSNLVQTTMLTHLSFLSPIVLSEMTSVSPAASSMLPEFMSAIGALCVVSGSTGYNVPVCASAVFVATRESNDDFVGPPVTKPVPASCDSNQIARMCSTGTRRGIVVSIDPSSSAMKVVFHDQFHKDARLSAEKVHWHRATSVPAVSAQDETINESISSIYPVITAKLVPALKTVNDLLNQLSRPSPSSLSDSAPLSRWLLSYLQTRLIRSMILVSNDDDSMRLLAGDAHILQLLLQCVAKHPMNQIGDLRAVGHEWSRCMESLIELKCSRVNLIRDTPNLELGQHYLSAEAALHYQRMQTRQPITTVPESCHISGNTIDMRTASHCLLENNNNVIQYFGDRVSVRHSRVKVDVDSVLPVLIKAQRPFEFDPLSEQIIDSVTEQRFYFEVSLLSDVAGVSIGMAPRDLPLHCLREHANRHTGTKYDETKSGQMMDSSVGGRHLFGWPEGSVVLTSDGDKARFWHSTKVVDNRMTNESPLRSVLHKHDLVDVQDSLGKFSKAIVIDETATKVKVHYTSWDERYDEWIERESERLATCHTRTQKSRATSSPLHVPGSVKDAASSSAVSRERVTGQLWRESYARPLTSRSTVGCGLIFHQPTTVANERRVSVYFTLDGEFCGIAYDSSNLAHSLFPCICMSQPESIVKVNFNGPFVYDFAHQSDNFGQPCLQHPFLGNGLTSMWSSHTESARHMTRHMDVSTSLADFNEESEQVHVPSHRLVSYQPVAPTATLYRRYDVAHSIVRTNFLPDISLFRLMELLEAYDENVYKVMDHIYDSELESPSVTLASKSQQSFTSQRSTSSPSMNARASSQSSPFGSGSSFSSPFNSAPHRITNPRFAGPFDDDEDIDEQSDLLSAAHDNHSVPTGVNAHHAYSFRGLRGPQSVNDYEADEAGELALHAAQERRSTFSSDPLTALLEAPSTSNPNNAQAVIQMLLQLRQLHAQVFDDSPSESGAIPLFEGPPELSDLNSALGHIMLSANPFASPTPRQREPPVIRRSDWIVGTIVCISRHAKQRAVSLAVNPITRADYVWTESMDQTLMQTGIIRAVDYINGMIAVEISDTERSRASLHWYHPASLTRLIALRGTAYLHRSCPDVLFAHLRHTQNRMTKLLVKQLLMMWSPQLTKIVRSQSTGLTISPIIHIELDLIRAQLLSWSTRAMQIFTQMDCPPSLVSPALPFSKAANRSMENMINLSSPLVSSNFAIDMLDWLIENHSTFFLSCFQHTLDQSTNHCRSVQYSQDAVTFKSVMTLPQPTSLPQTVGPSNRVLLYQCIHVPDASSLIITCLPGLILPIGVSLSFYTSPHFSRPCYQFQGQQTAQTVGRWHPEVNLPPISLPTNTVWVCLAADINVMKQSLNPSAGTIGPPLSLHIVFTPISERFGAGLAIVHRMIDRLMLQSSNQSPHAQLCLAFDKCVEIMTSSHTLESAVNHTSIPLGVRLPVLSLMIRLVRASPRGSLGDMRSLLPLLREMTMTFNECKIQVIAGREQIPGETPVYTQNFQRLVELHVAIVEHFQFIPSVPATPPISTPLPPSDPTSTVQMCAINSSSLQSGVNIHTLSHLSLDDLQRVNDDLQRQLLEFSHPSSLVESETKESAETGSSALSTDNTNSTSLEDIALHADFIWPQWFVEFYTAITCLKSIRGIGVLSTTCWPMTLKARRMSPIGMAADDYAETDHASRFDPIVEEELSNLFAVSRDSSGTDVEREGWRQCASMSFYCQLTQAMDKRAQTLGKSPLYLVRAHLVETITTDLTTETLHEQLIEFPLLRSASVKYVLHHASFLQTINMIMSHHLSMFDMSSVRSRFTLSALLVDCRMCLFNSVKVRFTSFVIEASAATNNAVSHFGQMSPPSIRINRLLASKAWETNNCIQQHDDPLKNRVDLVSQTIIGQSFIQMRGVQVGSLRRPRPRGGAPHTGFHVHFDGEQVLGQAGPYRQFFTDICKELQSNGNKEVNDIFTTSPLPLLVPTPNALHAIGESRHLFMINPAATNMVYLELFEHIGRLIGIAVRTKVLLSLDLPRLFWKQISGMYMLSESSRSNDDEDDKPWLSREILSDLDEIDHSLVTNVLEPASKVNCEQDFETIFGGLLFFPITRSDGTTLPNQSNEKSIPVTFETFHCYLRQLIEVRLGESRQQIDAIRHGLSDVIPILTFHMFHPFELSQFVCGSPEIDVNLLRRHTEYGSGLSSTSRHIQDFWAVLEEFSHDQRRAFIQFAYAQSRLPSDDAGFNAFPKIRLLIKPGRSTSNVDASFPHADTCFFNIELPAYSTRDVMRTRLTQVCEMGEWGLSGDEITTTLHPIDSIPTTSVSSTSNTNTTSSLRVRSAFNPPGLHTPATQSASSPVAPDLAALGFQTIIPSASPSLIQSTTESLMNSLLLPLVPQTPTTSSGNATTSTNPPPPPPVRLVRQSSSTRPALSSSSVSSSTSSNNQSISQSVNQSISQSNNQSNNQSINQAASPSLIGGFASSLGRFFSRRGSQSNSTQRPRDEPSSQHDDEDVE